MSTMCGSTNQPAAQPRKNSGIAVKKKPKVYHFSRRVTAYRALVGDTSAAVLRLVSRDLGRR